MTMMLGTAVAVIDLDISGVMSKANQFKSVMGDVEGSVGKADGAFGSLKKTALGLGTALIAPMSLGLKGAISLEQGIADVNASLGGVSTKELDSLSTMFQQIGADSKFSATEVAGVADELAKAGFTAEELLGGTTQAVIDLSQATGEGLGVATTGIVQAMNMWDPALVGVTNGMTDATVAADQLTIASNQSAGGVQDVIAGLQSFGPAAASVGISFGEASASIAYFTNFGYSGAEAGTKLARAMQFLSNPTEEAAAWMQQMGVQAFDAYGKFVGFPTLFDQLNAGMQDMTSEERIRAFKSIFGAEAYDAMLTGALAGGDALRALIGDMDQTGVAAEQARLRMDTFGNQFGTLVEGVQTFLASLLMGVIPGLRVFVDAANAVVDVLMTIPGPIKTVIGVVAGMLAGFAAVTHALTAFRAMSGLMTMLGGESATAASGLSKFVPILGIVALAAGAFYVAYKTNLLGIGDLTDRALKAADRFATLWSTRFKALSTSNNPVVAGLRATGEAVGDLARQFPRLSRILTPASRVLIAVGKELGSFGEGFDLLRKSFNPVQAGLLATSLAFGSLARQFPGAAPALMAVSYSFRTLSDVVGRVGPTLAALGSNFERARRYGLDPFRASFQSLYDTFPLLRPAMDALVPVVNSLYTAFSQITSGDILAGLQTIGSSLGGLAVSIGSWAISAVQDLGSAILDWVQTTAWPAAQDAAATIWGVIVNIGSWAKGIITDLWPYITQWTSALISSATSAAGTLWGVIVNIGSWAKGIVSDIGPYISQWASAAWSGITTAATTLWGVVVNVGSWAKGIVSDIAPYISAWASDAASGVTAAVATLWGVVVNIGSFAKGIISDIWPYISSWVADAWTTVMGGEVPIDNVKVKIGGYEVDGNAPALKTAVEGGVGSATDENEASAFEAGRSAGEKFRGFIQSGFALVFGSGGVGGGDGGVWDSGVMGQIAAWQSGFLTDIGIALGKGWLEGGKNMLSPAGDFLSGLSGLMDDISNGVQEQLDNLGPKLEEISIPLPDIGQWFSGWEMPHIDDLPGISTLKAFLSLVPDIFSAFKWPEGQIIPLPDILGWFGDWTMPSVDDIPGVTAAKELLQGIADIFTGWEWPSISIPTPDIDWPNPMDWVPQDVKDFYSDPVGYIMSHLSGGGSSKVDTPDVSVSPTQNSSGGGKAGELPGLKPFGSLLGLAGLQIPDATEITISITQTGAEAVAVAATAAHTAIAAIPTSWATSITQAGAESVASSSNAAQSAIQAIPTSWATSITESGGATVTSSADAAASAIKSIPTSWHTELSIAGAEAVESAANAAANAINAIPTSRTVSVNIVSNGVVALATGGTVPATGLARMGELGPEALRFPSGRLGMAYTDGLYAVPPGTYVFTAAETRMMAARGLLDGIPAFARGGTVLTGGGRMFNSIGDQIGTFDPRTGKRVYFALNQIVKATRDVASATKSVAKTLSNATSGSGSGSTTDPGRAPFPSEYEMRSWTNNGRWLQMWGLSGQTYRDWATVLNSAPRSPSRPPSKTVNRSQGQRSSVTVIYNQVVPEELHKIIVNSEAGGTLAKKLTSQNVSANRTSTSVRTRGVI